MGVVVGLRLFDSALHHGDPDRPGRQSGSRHPLRRIASRAELDGGLSWRLSHPPMGPVDRSNDLPAPFGRDATPAPFQIHLGKGVQEIAPAQGWPVQAICLIENHLMRGRPAVGAVGRTHDDIHFRLVGDAQRM